MQIWRQAIARARLRSITDASVVIGTPAYMPPEAWRGQPATQRSDVYSIGTLPYKLDAGARPHRGGSLREPWPAAPRLS